MVFSYNLLKIKKKENRGKVPSIVQDNLVESFKVQVGSDQVEACFVYL